MRRVNWTVTEGQHQALRQLSQNTGLSISELVRRALDNYIHSAGKDDNPALSPLQSEQADYERPKN